MILKLLKTTYYSVIFFHVGGLLLLKTQDRYFLNLNMSYHMYKPQTVYREKLA